MTAAPPAASVSTSTGRAMSAWQTSTCPPGASRGNSSPASASATKVSGHQIDRQTQITLDRFRRGRADDGDRELVQHEWADVPASAAVPPAPSTALRLVSTSQSNRPAARSRSALSSGPVSAGGDDGDARVRQRHSATTAQKIVQVRRLLVRPGHDDPLAGQAADAPGHRPFPSTDRGSRRRPASRPLAPVSGQLRQHRRPVRCPKRRSAGCHQARSPARAAKSGRRQVEHTQPSARRSRRPAPPETPARLTPPGASPRGRSAPADASVAASSRHCTAQRTLRRRRQHDLQRQHLGDHVLMRQPRRSPLAPARLRRTARRWPAPCEHACRRCRACRRSAGRGERTSNCAARRRLLVPTIAPSGSSPAETAAADQHVGARRPLRNSA